MKHKHKAKTAEKKFKAEALRMAKIALLTSVEWIDKKEITWALVNVRKAVKLLDVAGEV